MRCRSEVNIPEAGEARTKQACCSPQRRRDRRAHATTASWWNGMESELRSDWQAEARPTKAVRAALGWTGRRPIPQCSDEESMSCEEVSGETQRTQSSCHDGVVVEWIGKPESKHAPTNGGMAAWKAAPRSGLPERSKNRPSFARIWERIQRANRHNSPQNG